MNGAIKVWLNGCFLPMDQARISPVDRGFLYGDGFFETIRAERSKILWLPLHLERLEASLRQFKITLDPTPDWDSILKRLLDENGLSRKIAAIKILVTRGISNSLGFPEAAKPTICIMASPYNPPSRRLYEEGCKLHVYREGFAHPLAGHKSLNYLFNLSARQAALDCGCDMAMILDREGLVTETCTGSLFAFTEGQWWRPVSPFELPGTAVQFLCALMENAGIKVIARRAAPEDFCAAQTVWVLNSMIGILPVAQIDANPVPNPASEEAACWRRRLAGPEEGVLDGLHP
jgi:branched-subunit amino acid aminotransferase/4-amino-4-deoxychorismate lyase